MSPADIRPGANVIYQLSCVLHVILICLHDKVDIMITIYRIYHNPHVLYSLYH